MSRLPGCASLAAEVRAWAERTADLADLISLATRRTAAADVEVAQTTGPEVRHCEPGPLEAIAAALRPLLMAAEAQWREQYRLARALPDHWHGAGARAATEALFDNLDCAERTLTRIRAAIDTLDAAAQVLRAIGTRLEAAVAEMPDDDVAGRAAGSSASSA